jgi:hypothetical protein
MIRTRRCASHWCIARVNVCIAHRGLLCTQDLAKLMKLVMLNETLKEQEDKFKGTGPMPAHTRKRKRVPLTTCQRISSSGMAAREWVTAALVLDSCAVNQCAFRFASVAVCARVCAHR